MQEINPCYRYHKLWIAIGYMLIMLVIYFSVIGNPPQPSVEIYKIYRAANLTGYFDKGNHLAAYFVLMAWFAQIYHVKKQRIIYAVSFVSLGVFLEFFQSFELLRSLELADMLANSTGVLIAFLITKIPAFRMMLLRVESYI